jgi:hypothetical protein
MDSYITKKLKSSSINVVNKVNKIKGVSTLNLITYSLLLNAFAILALINGSFTLFIMLFLTSFYIQYLGKVNKTLKNDVTRMVRIYGRLSVWIMFGSVFYIIVTVYDQEITFPISIFFTFVLALCNINYSLKILDKIETKQFDNNEDINSYFLQKWASLFKSIGQTKREHISKLTRWFDEVMVIIIFVIITIYLNYTKNKNELIKTI